MFHVKVDHVVDGDTFVAEPVTFDFGEYEFTVKKPKFRLMGINTPEKGKPGAAEATSFTKQCLDGQLVRVDVVGKDDFGRFLAYIYIRGEEKSVNDLLLEKQLAVPFHQNLLLDNKAVQTRHDWF